MEIYIKDGLSLPYLIINKNNKHTYFRMRKDYLEVTKAKSLTKNDVLRLIDKNFEKFYQRYLKQIENIMPNNKIMLKEKEYEIIKIKNSVKRLEITSNQVIVNNTFKDTKAKKLAIYESYLKVMVEEIKDDVLKVLKANNIKQRPIRFGYFKSKYGSYHRVKDEITLNVILARLDINYLYYVLMHEYAHTLVFNHSKNFYKLLAKMMPSYKKYDKKLKKIAIYV